MAMDRRHFLNSGIALAASPLAPALAQDRGVPRIGFIGGGTQADSATFLTGLGKGLAEAGYAEPASIQIIRRFAEGKLGRAAALVAELEAEGVALIVTHAQATVPVVTAKPRRVPIVYQFSADPVASKIADSLAHPLYDATGVTLLAAELNQKRVELMREIWPSARRLSVVFNPLHAGEAFERQWIDAACGKAGFEPIYHATADRAAIDSALPRLAKGSTDVVLALADGLVLVNRKPIIDAAAAQGVPVVGGWVQFAESGAVFSYGPRLGPAVERAAYFVDRLLKGAKVADLPIERPSALELVINLDSAGKLGLDLPPSVLGRADRVIG